MLLFHYKAWLKLMEEIGENKSDACRIAQNKEAQHRYLTWRTEKVWMYNDSSE